MSDERNKARFQADSPRAAELWRSGATYAEIAADLGISTGLVGNWIHRLRAEDPTLPERKAAAWSSDEEHHLRHAFAAGRSVDEIAVLVGRSATAVDAKLTTLRLRPHYEDNWGADEDASLLAAWAEGLTVAGMTKRLRRPAGQINTRLAVLRRRGETVPLRKPRWTPDERERLAQRYREGATYLELAAEFGKAKGTISRQLRQMRESGVNLERLATRNDR